MASERALDRPWARHPRVSCWYRVMVLVSLTGEPAALDQAIHPAKAPASADFRAGHSTQRHGWASMFGRWLTAR